MRMLTCLIVAAALLTVGGVRADEPASWVGVPGLKTEALAADWDYSTDGGKTFAGKAPTQEVLRQPPTGMVLRATFDVADAGGIAFLWCRSGLPASTWAAGATKLAGKARLNGQAVGGPEDDVTYRYLPIDSGELLVKGRNSLTIPIAQSTMSPPLRLIAAAPQAVPIYFGPVLGIVGEDFFTVTCRTPMPASVTVTARPTEPQAGPTSVTSEQGVYHRFRVTIPKGTRRLTYTLTTRAGEFTASFGPFAARLPPLTGDRLRFAVVGNTRAHPHSDGHSPQMAAAILKAEPDLLIHAGQVVEVSKSHYRWGKHFFPQYGRLVSGVPTYLAPSYEDISPLIPQVFYTHCGMNTFMTWTQVFAGVRFVAVSGAYDCWKPGTEEFKWLEGVLKEAREPFVFVLNHYPGYSTGWVQARRVWNAGTPTKLVLPLYQCQAHVHPLAAKYNVTAIISACEFNYERCEPTPDKGVTQLVIGAGGAKKLRARKRNLNPFYNPDTFHYAHGFCVFDVEGDQCRMKYISIEDGKVLDTKTFKARK